MSLKTDLKKLRFRFYDEFGGLQQFRLDCEGVADKALEEFQPTIKKVSTLKSRLTRKRGRSVMFKLFENEPKYLVSPSSYRFVKYLVSMRANKIRSYPRLMNEMTLVYLTAIFEAYIVDVTRIVLIYNKTLLKSSRRVSYDETFGFNDIDALRTHLIEDETDSLSHKSFRDQCKFLSDKLGLCFESDLDSLKAAVSEIIETRHLLVHNRGVVNELYKRNVSESSLAIGDRRVIDDKYISDSFDRMSAFEIILSDTVDKKYCAQQRPRTKK